MLATRVAQLFPQRIQRAVADVVILNAISTWYDVLLFIFNILLDRFELVI